MGAQSSRLYFDGNDHKDIYYQGKYHTAMYKGNQLVWAKTDMEDIASPDYPVYFKEIDGELYGIYENGYIWELDANKKVFVYYDSVSSGISAQWIGNSAIFQLDKTFPSSTSGSCFIYYDIKEKKRLNVQTIADKDIDQVSKTVTNWKHNAAYIGKTSQSYESYILGSLNAAVGYVNIYQLSKNYVNADVIGADSSVSSKPTIFAVAYDSKNNCAYAIGRAKSWTGYTATNIYKITTNNGEIVRSTVSTPNRSFSEYADIDVIDDYLLIYGTGTKGQIYVMKLTTQENWYCGENQEYKGFYRILKKNDNNYYLLENNDGWITIYKSSDMITWRKVYHDDGFVYLVSGIYSAIFFEDDLYISTLSTGKCRVLRINGI